jgi:hypothetical protein
LVPLNSIVNVPQSCVPEKGSSNVSLSGGTAAAGDASAKNARSTDPAASGKSLLNALAPALRCFPHDAISADTAPSFPPGSERSSPQGYFEIKAAELLPVLLATVSIKIYIGEDGSLMIPLTCVAPSAPVGPEIPARGRVVECLLPGTGESCPNVPTLALAEQPQKGRIQRIRSHYSCVNGLHRGLRRSPQPSVLIHIRAPRRPSILRAAHRAAPGWPHSDPAPPRLLAYRRPPPGRSRPGWRPPRPAPPRCWAAAAEAAHDHPLGWELEPFVQDPGAQAARAVHGRCGQATLAMHRLLPSCAPNLRSRVAPILAVVRPVWITSPPPAIPQSLDPRASPPGL